jgi:hypothetical protein
MWSRRLRYLLLLTALCAAATCPAARRSCIARQRATEAHTLLEYLADRVAAHAASTGRVPPTAAGPTPEPACCARGGECSPDAALWSAPGWRELGFTIDGPHRYSYAYVPDPSGLSATVRAIGDVACDGTPHVLEMKLTLVRGVLSRTWAPASR